MRLLLLVVCCGVLAGGSIISGARQDPLSATQPGVSQRLIVAQAQPQVVDIAAAAGEFVRLVILREGTEIRLRVLGPDGSPAVDLEGRTGGLGPLHVLLLATQTGTHRLELALAPAATIPRHADIRLQTRRIANPQDLQILAADRLTGDGIRLGAKGSAESRRAAITTLQRALVLWQAADDDRGAADVLNRIGGIYYQLGDFKASLLAHNEAVILFDRAGDLHLKGQALGNAGVAHRVLGNLAESLKAKQQALDIARQVGDRLSEAYALHNVGAEYYSRGEYDRAIELYGQSIALKQELGDTPSIAPSVSNRGTAQLQLGDHTAARESYEQALQMRRAAKDTRGEAYDLQNLGSALDRLGQWQAAIDNLLRALPLFETVGDKRGAAQALHNIGTLYNSLGDTDRALDYYGRALPLRREIGDRSTIATTLQNIGSIHLQKTDFDRARAHLDEALALKQESRDRFGEAYTLGWLARLAGAEGNAEGAVAHAERALQLSREVKDVAGEAVALHQLGALHADQRNVDTALGYLTEALAKRQVIRHRRGEADTRYVLAKIQRGRGLLSDAQLQLESALELLESLRAGAPGPELRGTFFAGVQQFHELYIDVLMQRHAQEPAGGYAARALEASERARARRLLDMLAEANVKIRHGVDEALIDRERSLTRHIEAKEASRVRLLGTATATKTLDTINEQIRQLFAELAEIRARITAQSPHYVSLTSPTPLRIADIQARVLDDETLLLEYWLGSERSYLWAVTKRSLTAVELPGRAHIESAVRHLQSLITARQQAPIGETAEAYRARITKADAAFAPAAQALAGMLLAAPADALRSRRWLLVPDGVLEYLPFAALPAAVLSAGKTEAYRPLVAERELVTAPSASALSAVRATQAARPLANKTIAILADPVFSRDDERVGPKARASQSSDTGPPENAGWAPAGESLDVSTLRSARESGVERLGRLQFSRQEADLIAALAPADTLKALDFTATRAVATSSAMRDYRILHFATHALLNSQHPDLSGIVLSLVDREARPQNGFLRLHEIYNLDLHAQLVVLSACQTALGREIRGEGLLGLARGFMYAGVPRVVASLWRVDDRATAELMRRFYEHHLKHGLTPAAALRRAVTEMSRQPRWRAPYYWAGFSLQGDWR